MTYVYVVTVLMERHQESDVKILGVYQDPKKAFDVLEDYVRPAKQFEADMAAWSKEWSDILHATADRYPVLASVLPSYLRMNPYDASERIRHFVEYAPSVPPQPPMPETLHDHVEVTRVELQ